ncbi:hypothetical protein KY285_004539 [Solanum tuberosum]|nr:hypothetical protein KY285_004539 [Solanum tuberosum]
MANLPQSFSVGVGSFRGGGGMSSSSFGAGAPPNKDRKMQSAKQLVFVLYNPNLRENTLLELFKMHMKLKYHYTRWEGVGASPTLPHGLHITSLVVIYTQLNARLFFQ